MQVRAGCISAAGRHGSAAPSWPFSRLISRLGGNLVSQQLRLRDYQLAEAQVIAAPRLHQGFRVPQQPQRADPVARSLPAGRPKPRGTQAAAVPPAAGGAQRFRDHPGAKGAIRSSPGGTAVPTSQSGVTACASRIKGVIAAAGSCAPPAAEA